METKNKNLLPTSILQALEGMTLTFNPEEARNIEAMIQFEVSGAESGSWYLKIMGNTCTFHEGRTQNPTLTIQTPPDVWLKIARGEMSGGVALMTGKYKAKGDMGLLMKIDKIFSRLPGEAELAEKGWL